VNVPELRNLILSPVFVQPHKAGTKEENIILIQLVIFYLYYGKEGK
jgi:hypothetical protein